MFKVNKAEWDSLTKEDQKTVKIWRKERFPHMDTHAEDIDLPSGLVFRAFADARGFLLAAPGGEKEQGEIEERIEEIEQVLIANGMMTNPIGRVGETMRMTMTPEQIAIVSHRYAVAGQTPSLAKMARLHGQPCRREGGAR